LDTWFALASFVKLPSSGAMAALAAPRRRKIVDAFTFYNEFEMLEFRLAELYDHVDFS